MIRALLLAAAVQTVSPLVVQAPPNPLADPKVVEGRDLVRRNCIGCHSAEPKGTSVLPSAPPFRWMVGMRPDALKIVAAQVGRGDHQGMPRIILTDSEAEAISAYIHAFANADPKVQKELSLHSCLARAC